MERLAANPLLLLQYLTLLKKREEESCFSLVMYLYYLHSLSGETGTLEKNVEKVANGVDGANHYAYANCNPVMYNDPTGLEGEDQQQSDMNIRIDEIKDEIDNSSDPEEQQQMQMEIDQIQEEINNLNNNNNTMYVNPNPDYGPKDGTGQTISFIKGLIRQGYDNGLSTSPIGMLINNNGGSDRLDGIFNSLPFGNDEEAYNSGRDYMRKAFLGVALGSIVAGFMVPAAELNTINAIKNVNSATKVSNLIGDIEEFMNSQYSRLCQKLGAKLGEGRLPFNAGKEGFTKAMDTVRNTLANPTKTTNIIPKTSVRGDYDLIHIYSSKTNFTVSLRVLGNGKFEFDTLIPGISSKFY